MHKHKSCYLTLVDQTVFDFIRRTIDKQTKSVKMQSTPPEIASLGRHPLARVGRLFYRGLQHGKSDRVH
jgi:hypothetical protein